jgi:hypothetical protein
VEAVLRPAVPASRVRPAFPVRQAYAARWWARLRVAAAPSAAGAVFASRQLALRPTLSACAGREVRRLSVPAEVAAAAVPAAARTPGTVLAAAVGAATAPGRRVAGEIEWWAAPVVVTASSRRRSAAPAASARRAAAAAVVSADPRAAGVVPAGVEPAGVETAAATPDARVRVVERGAAGVGVASPGAARPSAVVGRSAAAVVAERRAGIPAGVRAVDRRG